MCISRDPSPTPNNDELTDEAGTWGLLFSAFGRATDEMLYPRFRDTGSEMGWAQNKAKDDVRILNAQDIEKGDYVKRRYTIGIRDGILTLGDNERGTVYYTLRPVRVAAWEAMWRQDHRRR